MNPDDDTFDEMMRSSGFAQNDADEAPMSDIISAGVIGPDDADDHTALHLLEALVQACVFLDAEPDIADWADAQGEPEVRRILSIGTSTFFAEVFEYVGESIEHGSPEDLEFMAFVRRSGGVIAQGLDQFLEGAQIRQFTCMAYLSGHGYFPFQFIARNVPKHSDDWKVT
ncbi:MAG TPA: hypothetical protein VNM39_10805 [Verrucomicrobiae bacterium]|nr:hypothetical protein [Verrucomicrobiae bacterium]